MRDSAARSRTASGLARGAGRTSVGQGVNNIKSGRAHRKSAAIRQGSMEVVQGFLGLLASVSTMVNSLESEKNAEKLENVATSANFVNSARPSAADALPTVAGKSGASVAQFELMEKENPEVKEAMALLEEEYGITRQRLIDEFAQGKDGRDLFVQAPKNAMTEEEASDALKRSRAAIPDAAAALAAEISKGQPTADIAAAAAQVSAVSAAPSAPRNGLRDALSRKLASAPSQQGDSVELEISAEVKEAIQAKEAAEHAALQAAPFEEVNLFQAVHKKYRERENHLLWGAPLRAGASGF